MMKEKKRENDPSSIPTRAFPPFGLRRGNQNRKFFLSELSIFIERASLSPRQWKEQEERDYRKQKDQGWSSIPPEKRLY
jgi:hypothetical protein